MKKRTILKGLLSLFLAAALFLFAPTVEAEEMKVWKPYFGLLHTHVESSASVQDAFAAAAQIEGLDFLALTQDSVALDAEHWEAGKAAAEAVCGDSFVGLYGYETQVPETDEKGYISTFFTQSWQRAGESLSDYYDLLNGEAGAVSQFIHPNANAYKAMYSQWDEAYADTVSLMEVGNGKSLSANAQYVRALQQGWKLAPTFGGGTYNGEGWTEIAKGRTVILAEELSEESIEQALRAKRVYASMDADLELLFTINGHIMGSDIPKADTLNVEIRLKDPSDKKVNTVQIMSGNGSVKGIKMENDETVRIALTGEDAAQDYYYLHISQSDRDIILTAPIWVSEDIPEESEPTEPKPTESEPTEPKPTESEPTEPKPTETEPTEPKPTETEPTEPKPTETEPTEPKPTETEPTEPKPTEPKPTESEPTEPTPTETEPTEPEPTQPPVYVLPEDLGVFLYFGLLHAHTEFSDGKGTVEEAYSNASEVDNLDFFAVTEHSNSFDNDEAGAIHLDGSTISTEWAAGKQAAKAATNEDFLAIFGYEMTWPDTRNLGHINTFGTPGWQSRNQKEFDSLTAYYEALTTVPGSVSQFNHPSPELGEFENFGHLTAKYDAAISLLEIGGEHGFTAYQYYNKALDAGWHVAPTNNQNNHEGNWGTQSDVRTVVLAEALQEDALYAAMSARRVYATEDKDLSLYYTLDGHLMGAITAAKKTHTLRLLLADPTDGAPAKVEVIVNGGVVLDTKYTPQGGGELEFSAEGGYNYYYLKITQEDGDIAVTAPVWTETYNDVDISQLQVDTDLPIQGEELTFLLTIYNEETEPFQLERLELYREDVLAASQDMPGTVPAGGSLSLRIPYTNGFPGVAAFRVVVTGNVAGVSQTLEGELSLSFRVREMTKGLLVDCSHSSLREGDFDNLAQLASEATVETTFFTEEFPLSGNILLLPPPETAYALEFLQQVKLFSARGGSVILCAASWEDGPMAVRQQNRVLEILGSDMRFQQDTALDDVHNGGEDDQLYPAKWNKETLWCEKIKEEQVYAHLGGCTVSGGTWLIRGSETAYSSQTEASQPVLLAWEEQPSKGHIFAAGSLFLSDEAMPLPQNRWDAATANQSILEALLGITRKEYPITQIAKVRTGRKNQLYHIKGYTTSGTSNPYNTFPDTIYLQDDTGGIPIVPFRDLGIQVGTAMEAVGYLTEEAGNPAFLLIEYHLPEKARYRYVPQTMNHSRIRDFDTYGGQLVQVEAEVVSLTLTPDGQGVSRFTLVDIWGDKATVMIEDGIFSGAYGTNTLAKEVKIGRTVRAMGLLHLDANGIPVLRVRNCEEVVWVPPIPGPEDKAANPYTGDGVYGALVAAMVSGLALLLLIRKRK